MNNAIPPKNFLTPAETVDASVKAFNAHDANAFAQYFSEDVQVFDHPDQLKLRNRVELLATYANAFVKTPQINTTVMQRIVVGNRVVDHERVQRTPDSIPFDVIVLNEVRDGLIEKLYLVLDAG
jgi:hypothetical protein